MNSLSAVDELFLALSKIPPEGDSKPDTDSAGIIVASTLRPIDSNGQVEQHSYDLLRDTLAQRRIGSLRKLACTLGFEKKDAGTLSDLLRGRYDHVSFETANRWALALGLPPIPSKKATTVCPSCLALGKREVHDAGDCHGAPVVAVVCLAPGEVVAPAPPPAKPRRVRHDDVTVHVSRETLRMLRAARQADLSDDMTLRRLLREYEERRT